MAAQIHEIAISARGVLLDPFVLVASIVVVLAVITGFAGRVAVVVEDIRYDRIHRRKGVAGIIPTDQDSADACGSAP